MKRLVVCCDGTWNQPDHLDRGVAAPTNVSKLALAVAPKDDEGNDQVLHYEPGVGTRRWERIRGGAVGIGLSRNVQECYRFLVESYEPGDELYFFGFSRGAFTARSTVGLVRNSGILRAHHRDRIEDAYRLYRQRDPDSEPKGIDAELFRRLHCHPDLDIQFVGVWDTVGALGIPIDGFRPPFLSKLWTFHDTDLSSHVRNAFHAVAIDEQRGAFEPTLWTQQPNTTGQTLEQVWFSGVHCDVGGGYRDPELSEIALLWMVEKARACGLAFDPNRLVVTKDVTDPRARRAGVQVAPDARGPLRDSLTSFYRLLPRHERRLAGKQGAAVDGGSLASSAQRRYREDPGYRPPGLSEWLGADRPVTQVQDGG
jgi:uncharacterized protein (DUF2235 family)